MLMALSLAGPQEAGVGHTCSSASPNIPASHTKYGRREPPSPPLSPPRTGSSYQSHMLPLGSGPMTNHIEDGSYHSSTLPRMSKSSKPKSVPESSLRVVSVV